MFSLLVDLVFINTSSLLHVVLPSKIALLLLLTETLLFPVSLDVSSSLKQEILLGSSKQVLLNFSHWSPSRPP
jgi:hypothetical protein